MKSLLAALMVSASLGMTRCTDTSEGPSSAVTREEGIQIRINDGEWITLPGSAQRLSPSQYTLHTAGIDVRNGHVSISWKGINPTGHYRWNFISSGPVNGNLFQSRLRDGVDYHSFYLQGNAAADSPGSIVVEEFGDVGDYVSGTFTLEKASQMNNTVAGASFNTVRIEGRFRVKRTA